MFLFSTHGTLAAESGRVLRLVLLFTKGILRDPKVRRTVMFYIMLVALVMLFVGVAFIPDQWARNHVWLFICYWLVCAWFTVAAMLLAVFDILLIRAGNRIRRRQMEADLLRDPKDGK